MRKRTRARELAIQLLYQIDIRKKDPVRDLSDDFWKQADIAEEFNDKSISDFTVSLVEGTCEKMGDIDAVITKYAENWQLDRMAVIDRNVLRMATYELLYLCDIPAKVSINEAVDLAKKYGDVESGKFVNGILDKISKTEKKRDEGKTS